MKTLIFVLALVMPAAALAQSATPVNEKSRAIFDASADHDRVDTFGTPLVDHYELEVIAANGTGAIAFTKGLGKPTPDASNTIAVVVPEFGGLTPNAIHRATVSAVNTGAASRSALSDPFGVPGVLPAPAAPTNVRVGP